MTTDQNDAPIVARAGTYYRNARYIMFTIIVVMGVWFLYDGYVKYPEANRRYDELSSRLEEMDRDPARRGDAEYLRIQQQRKDMGERHNEFSILVQKLLGFALPPVGMVLLGYWLRKSRGEIRLENDVLTVPGSPAVPISAIDEISKELWEKKGIATIFYTLPDNVTGKLQLDDFIYQARPIRQIVTRIEDELKLQDQLIAQAKANKESAASH